MDTQRDYPILEFDTEKRAMIEPHELLKPIDIPSRAVACFFQDVIQTLIQNHSARLCYNLHSELGNHPIYEIIHQGERVAVFHPGIGAPLAAGLFEEAIALGVRFCIACGGAGVLDNTIQVGEVIVPYAAIRDEGVSYHYLPPAREVAANPQVVATIQRILASQDVPSILTKTWTTDALYRETAAKVLLRKAEGCRAVEMEAAAFFAVAQFREVVFGQLLYGGDDVGSEEWSNRNWQKHEIRERLFWLAVESCLALESPGEASSF
jgi:uridine phosphorylase